MDHAFALMDAALALTDTALARMNAALALMDEAWALIGALLAVVERQQHDAPEDKQDLSLPRRAIYTCRFRRAL